MINDLHIVHVYGSLTNEFSVTRFEELISILPHNLHEQILRFHQWSDKCASLAGKLLLQDALRELAVDDDIIKQISYSEHKRPIFENTLLDFNISHTQGLVVCAVCPTGKVGIDVECVKDIEVEQFHPFFHPSEMAHIGTSLEPLDAFYNLWTKKEALLKAIGTGMYYPVRELNLSSSTKITAEDEEWHFFHLALAAPHQGCLVTNHSKIDLRIKFIDLTKHEFLSNGKI